MGLRRMCVWLTTRHSSFQRCFVFGFGLLLVIFIVEELILHNQFLRIQLKSPKNGIVSIDTPTIKNQGQKTENETMGAAHLQEQQTRRKYFAIFAEMGVISKWNELEYLYDCFLNPVDNSTRPCVVHCPEYSTTVELVLVDQVIGLRGKDVALYGLSPFTLLKNAAKLSQYISKINASQTLVLYSMESPVRVHKWVSKLGSLRYHVDMTYLASSNVHIPYAYYKPGSSENALERKTNYAAGKTGLIAWIGSNCVKEVFWPRMSFVEELGRRLPLDAYGKCGKLTCLPRLSPKCVNLIGDYKFYLALENSECRQYITEKFWVTCLLNGVVPVVYGAPKEDLQRHAPPNSYIHVSDFESTEELANYILKLDQSDELYNKYFEWRKHGSIIVKYPKMQPSYFCGILPFLPDGCKARTELSASVKHSAWFNSCRGNITRRFDISQVPVLEEWEPWILGENEYVND